LTTSIKLFGAVMRCNNLQRLILTNDGCEGSDPTHFQLAEPSKTCRGSILWIIEQSSWQPHAGDGSVEGKAKTACQLIFLFYSQVLVVLTSEPQIPDEKYKCILCINNNATQVPWYRQACGHYSFVSVVKNEILIDKDQCWAFTATYTTGWEKHQKADKAVLKKKQIPVQAQQRLQTTVSLRHFKSPDCKLPLNASRWI